MSALPSHSGKGPALPSDRFGFPGRRPLLGLRVITVAGVVDRAGVAGLRGRCLAELDRGGAVAVALDFTRITDCPSALLLALVQVNAAFRVARTPLHLIGLADAISTIVGRTRPARSRRPRGGRVF